MSMNVGFVSCSWNVPECIAVRWKKTVCHIQNILEESAFSILMNISKALELNWRDDIRKKSNGVIDCKGVNIPLKLEQKDQVVHRNRSQKNVNNHDLLMLCF